MSSVDKVALDYFDASINRISAWVVGFRNFQKALLNALLTPNETLKQLQDEGRMTELMVKQEEIKTLPLGLMNFQSQFNTDYGILCAGLMISIIPVLALYLKCSSQFIGGITAGAVKG